MADQRLVNLLERLKDEEKVAYEQLREDRPFSKIPLEEHKEIIKYALDTGRQTADKLVERFSSREPFMLAQKLKIKIVIDSSKKYQRGGLSLRSTYQDSPPTIIIYERALQQLENLLDKENFPSLASLPDLLSLHIAHEVFHHLEKTEIGIVARRLEVNTFSLGPIKFSSPVSSLSEIAAHTFTQHLLNLSFSPRLLDYLSLPKLDKVSLLR